MKLGRFISASAAAEIGGKLISWRSWIHVFHGWLASTCMIVPTVLSDGQAGYTCMGIALGACWTHVFIEYEKTEDNRKKDGADLDIFGYLMGFIIGIATSIWACIKATEILELVLQMVL